MAGCVRADLELAVDHGNHLVLPHRLQQVDRLATEIRPTDDDDATTTVDTVRRTGWERLQAGPVFRDRLRARR